MMNVNEKRQCSSIDDERERQFELENTWRREEVEEAIKDRKEYLAARRMEMVTMAVAVMVTTLVTIFAVSVLERHICSSNTGIGAAMTTTQQQTQTTKFVIQREDQPQVWRDVRGMTYATEPEAVEHASLLDWNWVESRDRTIPIRVIKRVTIEELVAEPTKDNES